MKLKHSVMVSMLGKIADRFHEYQPSRTFAQRLEMAKKVRSVDGIEVVYPNEFENPKTTVSITFEYLVKTLL